MLWNTEEQLNNGTFSTLASMSNTLEDCVAQTVDDAQRNTYLFGGGDLNSYQYEPAFRLLSMILAANDQHYNIRVRRMAVVPENINSYMENISGLDKYWDNGFYVQVYVVVKQINDTFAALTTRYKDKELKNISIGLMEDRYNKVYAYMPEKNVLKIFTNKVPTQLFCRKLLAITPAIFPDVMGADTAVKFPYPVQLLTGLVGDADQWWSIANDWIANSTYLSTYEDRKLERMVRQFNAASVKKNQDNLKSCERNIKDYESALADYYKKQREIQHLLNYADAEVLEILKEFIGYANKRPGVIKVDFDAGIPGVRIHSVIPCINYNPDEAQTIINKSSEFMKGVSKNQARLMKEIFVEHKYNILFENTTTINFNDLEVRNSAQSNYFQGFPQPHLSGYNCYGNNKTQIIKALSKKDYIVMLECLLAAVANLNFMDSPVTRWFRDRFENNAYTSVPCIQSMTDPKDLKSIKQIYAEYNAEEKATAEALIKKTCVTVATATTTVPYETITTATQPAITYRRPVYIAPAVPPAAVEPTVEPVHLIDAFED